MRTNILNYKVFTWNGHQWEEYAKFSASEEDDARETAKVLEFSEKKIVKITCEVYESSSQSFVNKLFYLSKNARNNMKNKHYGQMHESQSFMQVLPKLFFILFLALGLAVAASRYGTEFLVSSEFWDEEEAQPMGFALFAVIFVFVTIGLGLSFLPKISVQEKSAFRDKSFSNANSHGGFFKRTGMIADLFVSSLNPAKEKEDSDAARRAVNDLLMSAHPDQDDKPFVVPEMSLANKKTAQSERAQPAVADEPVAEKEKSLMTEKETLIVQNLENLLNAVLSVLQARGLPVDSYMQFGIRLLMAGALENVAERENLSEKKVVEILFDLFEKLQVPPYLIEMFVKKWDEYKKDEAYEPMLEHGHFLWESYAQNPSEASLTETVGQIALQWLTAKKEPTEEDEKKNSFFVVMFTDIVGSTGMTQVLGDKSAQQMVHVHNTIVRQALLEYAGREIKSTGDGLMASFTSVSAAIEAAIAMQKAFCYYNETRKNKTPLHIRIGMNAGEPIVEGNDLFGTVVQIASRVCSLADKDEIYVSALLKELSLGKPYVFEDKGEQTLKGISKPQQVFLVRWDTDISAVPS